MERTDSNTYRRVFEFIKYNGAEPFLKLFNEVSKVPNNSEELIEERLFHGRDSLSRVIRNNSLVTNFLREFKYGFLSSKSRIFDLSFLETILDAKECLKKGTIDLAISNMRKLEELKFGIVKFTSDKNYFPHTIIVATSKDNKQIIEYNDAISGETYFLDFPVTDIIKPFSDGEISINDRNSESHLMGKGSKEEPYYFDGIAETYRANFSENNWRICAENHKDHQCRYAYLSGLDINLSNIPAEEELSSYDITKEIKEARETIILTKKLPF